MPDASFLTVVIPAYNQGPFIRRTIESLLTQSVAPKEIILSNNHSTDETAEIIATYANRIRIVSPPRFMPSGEHLDFVISHVSTLWCAVLSSDDLAEPNYVAVLADSVRKHPEAALVHAAVLYIDKDEKTAVPRYALKSKYRTPFPANLAEQLAAPVVNFAAFAFRMDAFKQTGGFAPWLGMGDWPVFLELSQHGDFIYRRELIARYRCTYRPNINRERYAAMCNDERKIATELIPSLLKKAADKALMRRHIRASRRRLYRRVCEGAGYSTTAIEPQVAENLLVWGQFLGLDEQSILNYKSSVYFTPRLRERFFEPCLLQAKHYLSIIRSRFS